MMCGVETHLQRVMPATITTSTAVNGPLRSGSERDNEVGITVNDRTDITCSSSSPSKSQDLDKPTEPDVNLRRRNSDLNLPPSTPGTAHPPRPVSSLNDDLGSSDEVKVFKDEDDRDGNNSESHQAELLAEKSSLITESEQVISIIQFNMFGDLDEVSKHLIICLGLHGLPINFYKNLKHDTKVKPEISLLKLDFFRLTNS